MMRTLSWTLVAMMLLGATAAFAQEVEREDYAAAARSQELFEAVEMYKQMGMGEEQALFFAMLTSSKMDPAQMMLLMAMMEGGVDDDALGIMLLSQAMSGGKGGTHPVLVEKEGYLLIVEGGVLYKISLEEMKVEGSLPYAQGAQASPEATMAALGPMIQGAREKAMMSASLSNMKQLCLGMLMYAQDWAETLPDEDWAKDIYPYIKNRSVFVCPSQQDLPVGYAMNEKLLLAKLGELTDPSRTPLLFESSLGGENPIGGADDVPEGGVYNGGIVVGFADGHAKWMPVDQARELLEQEPF